MKNQGQSDRLNTSTDLKCNQAPFSDLRGSFTAFIKQGWRAHAAPVFYQSIRQSSFLRIKWWTSSNCCSGAEKTLSSLTSQRRIHCKINGMVIYEPVKALLVWRWMRERIFHSWMWDLFLGILKISVGLYVHLSGIPDLLSLTVWICHIYRHPIERRADFF